MQNSSSVSAFGAVSDTGNYREHNEDTFYADAEKGLWLVIDGMGGHQSGEVAAKLVHDTVIKNHEAGMNLVRAIDETSQSVIDASENGIGSPGMGATIVALEITQNRFEVAWVGDSRAYLCNGQEIRQISRDHSLVQDMLDSGVIDHEQAAIHPSKHVITQALGISVGDELIVESKTGEIIMDDRFVLCSDGMSDVLSDQTIVSIVNQHPDDQEAAEALMEQALQAGSRDNITVVVVSAPPHITTTERDYDSLDNIDETISKPPGKSPVKKKNKLLFMAIGLGAAMAGLLAIIFQRLLS